jgi:hypothetical protein
LGQTREANRALAETTLARFDRYDPGYVVASQSLSQMGVDPSQLSWTYPDIFMLGSPFEGAAPNEVNILELESFVLRAGNIGDCKGFALSLNGVELSRDTTIPSSRGFDGAGEACPLEYGLEQIVCDHRGFWSARPEPRYCVAIISVYSFGFHGHNRDYIGVPFPALRP